MALGIYGEMHAALRVCFLKSENLARFITCYLQLWAMSPLTRISPEGMVDRFACSREPAVEERAKRVFITQIILEVCKAFVAHAKSFCGLSASCV